MNEPHGRIALVTGASRGIGYHTALELGRTGHHVIAVARTQGGLEELDDAVREGGGSATLVPLDLRDTDGIDRLNGALHERFGRLDVLVGNAGMLGTQTPLSHMTPADWNEALAVNLTANWHLIRALEPLLHQSKAARALFVTSGAAHKTPAYSGAYSVTKAALNALVRTWANENRQTGLKVNLFSPGPVATRMRAQYRPGEDPDTLPAAEAIASVAATLVQTDVERSGDTFDFASRSWISPSR